MKVRVFFNDAIGGAVRDNAESQARRDASRMRGVIQYNPYCDGYDAERAVLVESRLSPLSYNDDFTVEQVCENVFMNLNADDRANGQFERSLSVGDVVEVGGEFFAVADVGFVAVDAPEALIA